MQTTKAQGSGKYGKPVRFAENILFVETVWEINQRSGRRAGRHCEVSKKPNHSVRQTTQAVFQESKTQIGNWKKIERYFRKGSSFRMLFSAEQRGDGEQVFALQGDCLRECSSFSRRRKTNSKLGFLEDGKVGV